MDKLLLVLPGEKARTSSTNSWYHSLTTSPISRRSFKSVNLPPAPSFLKSKVEKVEKIPAVKTGKSLWATYRALSSLSYNIPENPTLPSKPGEKSDNETSSGKNLKSQYFFQNVTNMSHIPLSLFG